MYVCLPENEKGTRFTVDVDEVLAFIDGAERFSMQRVSTIDTFITEVLEQKS